MCVYVCVPSPLGDLQVCFTLLVGFSLVLLWMADRERDEPYIEATLDPVDVYDSDWLYSCVDHAVNQMVFVYSAVVLILVAFVDPSAVVSHGHHQPLGDCSERETVYSLVGLAHQRSKFLCVHEFDEEFNFCNYPLTQLHYEDSWYMICGSGYNALATYVALVLTWAVAVNLVFYQALKRPKTSRAVSFQKKYM